MLAYTKRRHGSSEDMVSTETVRCTCSVLVHQFASKCTIIILQIPIDRQKKLLVSSSEYGKDLYGVQRHLKNHQHLENELDTHESTLHVIIYLSRY